MIEPIQSVDSSGRRAGPPGRIRLGRSRYQPGISHHPYPGNGAGLLSLRLRPPGRDHRLPAARLVAARPAAIHPVTTQGTPATLYPPQDRLSCSSWRLQRSRIARARLAVCEVVINKIRTGYAPAPINAFAPCLPCRHPCPGRAFLPLLSSDAGARTSSVQCRDGANIRTCPSRHQSTSATTRLQTKRSTQKLRFVNSIVLAHTSLPSGPGQASLARMRERYRNVKNERDCCLDWAVRD